MSLTALFVTAKNREKNQMSIQRCVERQTVEYPYNRTVLSSTKGYTTAWYIFKRLC